MSMVKEITEFTDGYQIAEEVSDVLTKQNKHLLDYVKEFSDIVITKGILDLNSFNEFPIEFDGVSPNYLIKDTFLPLIADRINNLQTFKAKVYLIAQKYLKDILNGADAIEYFAADIQTEEDIESSMDSIKEEMECMEWERDVLEDLNNILSNPSLDDSKIVRIHLYKNHIEDHPYYLVADFTKDNKNYFFQLPRQFFIDYENKQSDECWLELPENMLIEVYGKEENIATSAQELSKIFNQGTN